MLTIGVKTNVRDVKRVMNELERKKAPLAIAVALTKTAKKVQGSQYFEMASVFDQPTRFTLNSLYVHPATPKDQKASVEFKDGYGSIPAYRFLQPQIEGGVRVHKGFERALIRAGHMRKEEFAVPGKHVELDQHGNLKGSFLTRVLSQLGAAEHSAGYMANMTKRSKKGNVKRAGGRYFVMGRNRAGNRDQRNVQPGIYLRSPTGAAYLIIAFVKQPKYQKRYDHYGVAERVVDLALELEMSLAFEKYCGLPRR